MADDAQAEEPPTAEDEMQETLWLTAALGQEGGHPLLGRSQG